MLMFICSAKTKGISLEFNKVHLDHAKLCGVGLFNFLVGETRRHNKTSG